MGTVIRPEISRSSKYWISKHRYYELKHLCMQYAERVKADTDDPVVALIEKAASETDTVIGKYILTGVTTGMSYDILKVRYNVPCCKQTYYDLYRRFFWLLSEMRK